MSELSRTLAFVPLDPPPPFARGGFAPLATPFRAPLVIAQTSPGDLTLSTELSVAASASPLLVWWQVARDPCFARLERYGFVMQRPWCNELTIALTALELGRFYWARLWAAGNWSAPAHVRVRSHHRTVHSSRERAGLARRLARVVPAERTA